MNFEIFDLGLIDFKEALDFQRQTHREVESGKINSAVIFCRHNPVITLGRTAKKENILISQGQLRDRGIGLYKIERGGDVTYHGPGQLMIYPVLNLNFFRKDLHWFMRKLEDLGIWLLGEFGAASQRIAGKTGVWCDERKIASIGITVRKWVSSHGLAININRQDLANFSLIRPCGMDIMMTSLESELDREIDFSEVTATLKRRLQNDQSVFA